jgi:DNA-binding transcriptional MerR regulator
MRTDAVAASIFERWRRGLAVTDADFLAVRARALEASGETAGAEIVPAVLLLLTDIMLPLTVRLWQDYTTYYELDSREVLAGVFRAFQFAVRISGPEVIAASTEQGSDFARHIVDITRHTVWVDLRIAYLDTSSMGDDEFRKLFEREWGRLVPYRDVLYDFRVIPRLPLDAFVRYNRLPRGDRKIRRIVSNYLVHQAKEYPHIFKPWIDFTAFCNRVFFSRLQEIYELLVRKAARRAVSGQRTADRHLPEAVLQDMLTEAERKFREDLAGFEFHFDYPGRKRPLGSYGLLGFAENPEARRLFDEMMRTLRMPYTSNDLAEIGFAHCIERRLTWWVAQMSPAEPYHPECLSLDAGVSMEDDDTTLGDVVAGSCGWQVNPDSAIEEEPSVAGPDGIGYLAIEQAARRCRVSVDQLRYIDRIATYKPLRAKEVFGKCCPLPRNMRLYPSTPEAWEQLRIAILRLKTHSSRLAGTELPRKQAALKLGIPVSTLRSWEKSGKLLGKRRGKMLVCDESYLERAKELLGM